MIESTFLTLVPRLPSRVFLGLPRCRDEEWLELARGYTVAVFMAASELREVSLFLRPIPHRFRPRYIEAQRRVRRARDLIDPESRRGHNGLKRPKLLGWSLPGRRMALDECICGLANGRPCEYSLAQLALIMAAIHTTTEVTTRAVIDICGGWSWQWYCEKKRYKWLVTMDGRR